MHIRFDDKIVAVSGAGHGFGRAIARRFASLGARVFATDVTEATLTETAATGGITPQSPICAIARRARPGSPRLSMPPVGRSTCW
jgi:NAD(P)-dependent dehydrogenase (short-subunit alcohol dehydrogenase family)